MSGKDTARTSGDTLTLIVAVAITLVGIGVIAGWHLHVRSLVQVVPGVIPMQYNTALCFITLGASAFLLVAGRGPRILPILGALFVTLMGWLVAYQYATGIKVGIDAAFFYPWDQTLSADPGRMALTSAISFMSAGVALLLLAWRPRSLAIFAIAHTLPLSLGLTSMLGYLAGVTYVLPSHLGSQMAVHTAFAFLAYGGVMLGHAWRLAPLTEDGLPGWSPVMAIAMVPVLFIGISVTNQSDSVWAWSFSLFTGLLMAGLFGLAAYKLAQLRIALKGFILISVPLIFVLAFVVLVIQVTRQNEQSQNWYLHSKEVIAQTESISRSLLDAEASIRGYVITGDPLSTVAYKQATKDIPEGLQRLQTLVKDSPEQDEHAARIGTRAAGKMAFLAGIEQLVRDGKGAQAVEQVKSIEGLRLMDAFRLEIESFLEEEQQLDAKRHKTVEESWQRFNWLLIAGASIDILLTLMLAVLFTRGISERVRALTENAQALAKGKELTVTMKGTDEIAHLDHVFHDMARALTEAARKESAHIENSLDVICSIDEEGKFAKVSPASYKVWGYSPEELIGRYYIDLVVPEDVDKTNQAAVKIMAGHSLTNFENCYLRKDGSRVSLTWSAYWSETEKLMYCVAHDDSERKQAEAALRESEERYRLLFESNPHPIWVYDLDTLEFLTVNKAAIQHYGYSREEFLSMTIKDIRPHEDVGALLDNVAKVSASSIDQAGTWRHRKKDGEIIYVEIISHQLLFNGRNAELVLANDITERKQAEKLVDEQKQELETMAANLTTTNKELEAFSYSVSHDLRAPLRAVDGFSRILLEDYADKLDDEGRRVLGIIRTNTQNMGRLIDDLLAFSRFGRKQIEPSTIDIGELARDVFVQLDSDDNCKAPRLEIKQPPVAYGDRALMRQVFVNLLSNAAKYSKPAEAAVIEVGGHNRNGENIYYVKDNGVGFDMKYVNKLFGVFQRLHSAEEFEGTGVGLAIVRRIVERHGGRVWAEGKTGEGATFYFTLPKNGENHYGQSAE